MSKMISLSELKLHPSNPKNISETELEKLKDSIKGFEKMMSLKPIIYDENNFILVGNQRRKALESLGYTEIPKAWTKQVLDLTEDEKKEFIVRDNVENGNWVMSVFEEDEFWDNTNFDEWLGHEEEDIDADAFFSNDGDGPEDVDKKSMTFTFKPEDFKKVQEALKKIDDKPETAIWKALNL